MSHWVGRALPWAARVAIEGFLVAIVLALLAPMIADRVSLVSPTCDDPRGLTALTRDQLEIEADGHQDDDSHEGTVDEYFAEYAFDGSTGSLWIPPLQEDTESADPGDFTFIRDRADLKVTFRDQAQDLRLICVVNGLANSEWNYLNWGRVRTVSVETDQSDRPAIGTLRTLGHEGMTNLQALPAPKGDTKSVTLTPLDYHHGQYIEMPRGRCDPIREPPPPDSGGCILPPEPMAGLAEVTLYVWPRGVSWWKALITGV